MKTYRKREHGEHAVWGNLNAKLDGKPLCGCLQYEGGLSRYGEVQAYDKCPNCKGFGLPPVPYEDVE